MTISTETYRVEYAGNGGTTVFSTSFAFLSNGDVFAILRTDSTGAEVAWVEATNYTLTGAGTDAAGSLTALVAPASGTTLVIYRDPAVTQPTSFPLGGDFPSDDAEAALDRIVMISQKLRGDIDAATRFPTSDDTDLSGVLPNSVDRASKFAAWDSSGEWVAAAGTSANLTPVSAFIDTLLDDANAAAARTTLGIGTAGTATTGTSGATVPLLNGNNTHSGTSTFTGTVTVTATADLQQQVKWSGVISPTSLSADQNNWSPTGLSTASVIRVDTTADRSITGLAGGASGRKITIENISATYFIGLVIQSGSSTAANRFDGSRTINIGPLTSVTLIYDNTAQFWRAEGGYVLDATAAEMEAATSNVVSSTPGRQHRHPGHPKSWVNIDQTGTLTNVKDFGISSLTDTNVGRTGVTFDTAFSDALYVAVGMGEDQQASAHSFVGRDIAGTQQTTAFPMSSSSSAGAAVDRDYLTVLFCGDQ